MHETKFVTIRSVMKESTEDVDLVGGHSIEPPYISKSTLALDDDTHLDILSTIQLHVDFRT